MWAMQDGEAGTSIITPQVPSRKSSGASGYEPLSAIKIEMRSQAMTLLLSRAGLLAQRAALLRLNFSGNATVCETPDANGC